MFEYTDIKNRKHCVIQSVRLSGEERREREESIIEELYAIFIKK